MRLFACPHCNDVVEFLGDAPRQPQCECGALLELVEIGSEADGKHDAVEIAISIVTGG